MNQNNIRRVADAIQLRTLKMSFDMKVIIQHEPHTCETVGCIAGYAAVMDGQDPAEYERDGDLNSTAQKAADFLGLDSTQRDLLFFPDSEIDLDLDLVTPEAAVWVLRNLAETGLIDWDAALKATT